MDEMNLNQIAEKLNEEFAGEGRKLVFWYDAAGEFAEDIDAIELKGAKLYKLEKDNQFYTKYFLEKVDTETSYLLYAPFEKPDIRSNHLADTLRYSREFFADKTSLICIDLGIRENLKAVIQRHLRFFANKQRTADLYALDREYLSTKAGIEDALMAVLCRTKTVSFEEILSIVLKNLQFEENPYLAEFEKYDLLEAFWEHCERELGYVDAEPTLEKLVITCFATYMFRTVHTDIPKEWTAHLSNKAGSVMTFMAGLMNSSVYGELFDRLSARMEETMNAEALLRKLPMEALTECCAFACIDNLLISCCIDRVLNEEMDVRLENLTIPELCRERSRLHFGSVYADAYAAVESAYNVVANAHYTPVTGVNRVAERYIRQHHKVDRNYREFYYRLDRMEDPSPFEKLKEFVENLYTGVYLEGMCTNWSQELEEAKGETSLTKQMKFYDEKVVPVKDRLVVIISDALRYEVGYELYERLDADEKCTATITPMTSVLPSFTQFGMAALLPHRRVEISDDYTVVVDERPCGTIAERDAILKAKNSKACAVRFDDIKGMSIAELRDIFTGMELVYVYHNQIDARGDKPASENEVFNACEDAVTEIHNLMRRLNTSANTHHFMVTADHGFLYRRSKLTAADKISGIHGADRRYALQPCPIDKDGVVSIPMESVLGYQDGRYAISPMGADLFNAPGAGLNYTHGGCSPQEMIIPLVEAKLERSKVETRSAKLDLVVVGSKITNLITNLDFIQTEPVSDTVKEATYRLSFVDEDGTRVSNEVLIAADSTDENTVNRKKRVKFSFKDQKYPAGRKYYLIITDDKTNMETLRKEFRIDIAFAGDFDF